MSKIFIIHGVQGYPEENWFPWLKEKLEALGHQVFVPQFPTPEDQTLSSWMSILENYKDHLTPETIFVGHSLGVPFVLDVLEIRSARAAFLVAGFVGKAGNQFDDGMKTFAQKPFDWAAIKNHCSHFTVFHADNDPYIALEKGQEVADHIGVPLTIVKGAGHFNASAGYDHFELLLEKIKEVL